jgi:hypothetical protein
VPLTRLGRLTLADVLSIVALTKEDRERLVLIRVRLLTNIFEKNGEFLLLGPIHFEIGLLKKRLGSSETVGIGE